MREPLRFRTAHFVLAILLILSIAAVASDAPTVAAGQQPPLNVLVTNSTSEPVPTLAQGSTSVTPTAGAVFRVQPGVEPVTLQSIADLGPGVGSFRRIFLNGGSGNDAFIVPQGKVLVITDITWNGYLPEGTQDRVIQFFLSNADSNPPPGGYGDFMMVSRARLDSSLTAIAGENMTSGVAIGPNRQFVYHFDPSASIGGAFLQGYLIPVQ
jgi:hypothetical protein